MSEAYYQFASDLIRNVTDKLRGKDPLFERLEYPDKPSKLIILGTLGDQSKNFVVGEEMRTLTSVKNNSMSIKFLVRNSIKDIKLIVKLSLYYRVYPTYQEMIDYLHNKYGNTIPKEVKIPRIWKRKDCVFKDITITISDLESSISDQLDFSECIQEIKQDNELYTGGDIFDKDYLETEESFEKEKSKRSKSSKDFNWEGKLVISKEKYYQEGNNLNLITVMLENITKSSKSYETFFFDCNLEISLPPGCLIAPFKLRISENSEKSYETYTRALNCQAIYDKDSNRIHTIPFAYFEQKKISPRSEIGGLRFTFKSLAKAPDNIKLLRQLLSIMENYYDSYKRENANQDRIDHFKNIIDRFSEGIELLESNQNALKAFELLNETFLRSGSFDSWRIFQIVFIVSNLPDVVEVNKRRDICEVLHVHTGGGKTESYLGLVVFSAFYDRLIGREFGVTAITKFPLRMLSVQQLQRIARIIAWAEEVRKEKRIGGYPFSVAYFVGNSEDFPRYTKVVIDKIKKEGKSGKELSGKIIDKCPICGGEVVLDYNEEKRYVFHKCKKCGREFRLFYSDEEIYRFLPTLIVGTVDKFAGISLNRRYKNIFGGKLGECPKGHGFVPRNDKCEVELDEGKCDSIGKPLELDFHTGPRLVIQDELHLVKEGFGTINSHFESLMEVLQQKLSGFAPQLGEVFMGDKVDLQQKLSGFAPKRIAMTATITGVGNYIRQLYNKQINVFPGESPLGVEKKDLFFELENDAVNRILIGLKPNFRDNQYASLLTLKYISEFIMDVYNHLEEYSRKHGISVEELQEILQDYKAYLTYHNKKADVYSMNYYLDAVVNSKLDEYKIIGKTLTGDDTLDDIKEIISYVDDFLTDEESKNKLLAIFATNIVSHGVDIEKWNLMIFQGIPRSTAEYIQALSRIGRKQLGIVFLWFYPNRTRDLSYYKNFVLYHQHLDEMVEEVPIIRWTKLGFKQTITSIFNASILNYMSEVLGRPLYRVDDVNEVFKDPQYREMLIDFIKEAYFADSSMMGAEYFRTRIPEEVEKRLDALWGYTGPEKHFFPNALADRKNKYFRTQYGMRGIQDMIILSPEYRDEKALIRFMEWGKNS